MCGAGAPGAPSNLSAAVNTGTSVDLTWTAATGVLSGYRVERSTDGGITWLDVFDVPNPAALGYTDTTSQGGVTYWYQVFAYNAAGDPLPSNVAQITVPNLPPAAPSDLQATTVLSNRVDLAWTDNANNEDGFIIQRSDDMGATWGGLSQTATDVATFSDATVQPKTTYMYRVYAFNGDGNSGTSNEITVVTPGEIPQAPSRLKVGKITRTTVALSWRDNATNETGYTIEVSTDNFQTWTVIQLPANATSYNVTGLSGNTTYWFRVQAYNADGVSAYSEVVSAKTKKK
ncbi:MAG: fibronectin type III domain-containing protein [Chloroflexi bacterium]|nr:fibronectin type III domain-containing protein [Chloroflexota bacterium]